MNIISPSFVVLKFILNIFIIGLFFLFAPHVFSQIEKNNKAVYEYTSTSENAIDELYKLAGDDKIKIEKVLVYINELEKEKISVLSSEEYLPIKNRIDYFNNNYASFSKEEYKSEKAFTSKLRYKFIVITDLIKMEL